MEVAIELQRYLIARREFVGEVSAEDLGFPSGFDGAWVFRGSGIPGGPHVSSPSGGYWCPPNVGKIVEKLRDKAHEPTAPMELFAYATHDEPDGSVGSLQGIQAAVTEHLPGSLFERVHVLHVGFRQHIWSSP